MRKLFNHKAGRRLLTVLTVSAMVISLFCMGGLQASAANTDLTLTEQKATALELPITSFATGVAYKCDVIAASNTSGSTQTKVDKDGNGDGQILRLQANKDTSTDNTGTVISSNTITVTGLNPKKTYKVSLYYWGSEAVASGNLWINSLNEDGTTAAKHDALLINYDIANGTAAESAATPWATNEVTFTPVTDTVRFGFYMKNTHTEWARMIYVSDVLLEEADASFASTAGSVTCGKVDMAASGYTWAKTTNVSSSDTTPSLVGAMVEGGVDDDGTMLKLTKKTDGASSTHGVTYRGFDPSKPYTISFWLKSDAFVSNSNIYINGHDLDETSKNPHNINPAGAAYEDWTHFVIPNVYPSADGRIAIGVWLKNTTEDRVYCFDGMSIWEDVRPDVKGATIAATADEAEQDMRYEISTEGILPDNAIVKEYGAYLIRSDRLGDAITELTEETYQANKGTIIKGSETLEEGAELPDTIYVNLKNAVNLANRCGVEISLRAYVIYTLDGVDYTVYSKNTSDTPAVDTGVASRSVYGVAKTIAAQLCTEHADALVDTSITYDSAAGTYTYTDGNEATEAQILAFCLANISVLG